VERSTPRENGEGVYLVWLVWPPERCLGEKPETVGGSHMPINQHRFAGRDGWERRGAGYKGTRNSDATRNNGSAILEVCFF